MSDSLRIFEKRKDTCATLHYKLSQNETLCITKPTKSCLITQISGTILHISLRINTLHMFTSRHTLCYATLSHFQAPENRRFSRVGRGTFGIRLFLSRPPPFAYQPTKSCPPPYSPLDTHLLPAILPPMTKKRSTFIKKGAVPCPPTTSAEFLEESKPLPGGVAVGAVVAESSTVGPQPPPQLSEGQAAMLQVTTDILQGREAASSPTVLPPSTPVIPPPARRITADDLKNRMAELCAKHNYDPIAEILRIIEDCKGLLRTEMEYFADNIPPNLPDDTLKKLLKNWAARIPSPEMKEVLSIHKELMQYIAPKLKATEITSVADSSINVTRKIFSKG